MKTYLVVGAGPVGTRIALALHEEFGKAGDVSIKIMEKREAPSERRELLYLKQETFETLPAAVQKDLLSKEDPSRAKAVFSAKSYNQLRSAEFIDDPHMQMSISDLEKALCDEVKRQAIPLIRNREFMAARKDDFSGRFIATFRDKTGKEVNEYYDEMIIAIGLGGALKKIAIASGPDEEKLMDPTPPAFGVPRLLHGFPVVAAMYAKDFRKIDHAENPSAITYPTKNGLVGIGYTLDTITIFTTVHPDFEASLSDPLEREKYINEARAATPVQFKHYFEGVGERISLKYISAVCALNSQFDNPELRIHPAGDMLATFPFTYGSETNVAYVAFLPRLMDYLKALASCSDERDRMVLSKEYCNDLAKLITSNENFTRLLPFGDKIYMGEKRKSEDGKRDVYYLPSWEELAKLSSVSVSKDAASVISSPKVSNLLNFSLTRIWEKDNLLLLAERAKTHSPSHSPSREESSPSFRRSP